MQGNGNKLPVLPPTGTTMDTITGEFTPHQSTWK
jgi:hypothetical protein